MAHKERVIKIKTKSGGMGAIKVDKKKKKKKVSEVYENPYFGKKKPTGVKTMTWNVTKNYKLGKGKDGRTSKQFGGRTRLLEELGRVEAEPSNRNRRAEISRVHGELNRGYSHGGPVGVAERGFNKKILRKV